MGAVRRQEAASDGGPGGANHIIDPQHDLHAVFAQNTLAHLNRTRSRRIKEYRNIIFNISVNHKTQDKVFFCSVIVQRGFVCKLMYGHTIESDKLQGVSAILHRWWVLLRQCRFL